MEDWRVERLLSEYSPQDEGRYAEKVNSMQVSRRVLGAHNDADCEIKEKYLAEVQL